MSFSESSTPRSTRSSGSGTSRSTLGHAGFFSMTGSSSPRSPRLAPIRDNAAYTERSPHNPGTQLTKAENTFVSAKETKDEARASLEAKKDLVVRFINQMSEALPAYDRWEKTRTILLGLARDLRRDRFDSNDIQRLLIHEIRTISNTGLISLKEGTTVFENAKKLFSLLSNLTTAEKEDATSSTKLSTADTKLTRAVRAAKPYEGTTAFQDYRHDALLFHTAATNRLQKSMCPSRTL